MPKPGNTGLERIRNATRYSWQGLRAAWQHESAFRQECVIALLLAPAAFFVGESPAQVALLVAVLGLVLITELLNSAVEAVVDRISDEHHDLSGRAKDMASAAVAVSLTLVVTVWAIIAVHNLFL
ncbi:MAG: diacylglycerol kinase [Pseudomonadota bacterium]